jgi:hypothetical protein
MLDRFTRSAAAWPTVDQPETEPPSATSASRCATLAGVPGSETMPSGPDEIERLRAELERIRAERDRLFRVAVSDDQLDQYGIPGGCSQTESITRVLEWLTTFDLPDGEIAAALADHDRRSTR